MNNPDIRSHRPTARIIRTTAEKFQQSQGLTNWADRENMKAASKALNEMMTAEGEERDRAKCIYIQLLHGLDECSDEDE